MDEQFGKGKPLSFYTLALARSATSLVQNTTFQYPIHPSVATMGLVIPMVWLSSRQKLGGE